MALGFVVDLIPNHSVSGSCSDGGANGEGESPIPGHLQQAQYFLPFGACRQVTHSREAMTVEWPTILQWEGLVGGWMVSNTYTDTTKA